MIPLDTPTFTRDLQRAMDAAIVDDMPDYRSILLEHNGRTASLSEVLEEGRRRGGWHAFNGPDPEGLVLVLARELLTPPAE